MRRTLRRSCAACAKAKHGCDLQTPKCSRCVERNSSCVYANQPLSSQTVRRGKVSMATQSPQAMAISSISRRSINRDVSNTLPEPAAHSSLFPLSVIGAQPIDPFDTYPSTSLPRERVQGLIYHCESPRLNIVVAT